MSELLSTADIDAALADSPWMRDGTEIVLIRRCESFPAAIAFVNAVADIAEELNHHPNFEIVWDTVTLRLYSHDAGGLTRRDLDLAAAVANL